METFLDRLTPSRKARKEKKKGIKAKLDVQGTAKDMVWNQTSFLGPSSVGVREVDTGQRRFNICKT